MAIIESNSGNASFLGSYVRHLTADIDFFRPRKLTKIEQSIVVGHMNLINLCSDSDICLILEDDALFEIIDEARDVKAFIAELQYFAMLERPVYIDYNDDYLPRRRACLDRVSRVSGYYYYPVGLTRTASAYALNAKAIQIILNETGSYSLPFDLHLQYVLRKAGISGFSKINNLFKHASKNGMYNSSTSE